MPKSGMINGNVTLGHLGSLASPGDLEESASHHVRRPKSVCLNLSADLSRCVLNFLPGRFTFLKWFPLRVDRTFFVSLDKTKHSLIKTLQTLTLRVFPPWGSFGCSISALQNKYFQRLPDSKTASETLRIRFRSTKQVVLAFEKRLALHT